MAQSIHFFSNYYNETSSEQQQCILIDNYLVSAYLKGTCHIQFERSGKSVREGKSVTQKSTFNESLLCSLM